MQYERTPAELARWISEHDRKHEDLVEGKIYELNRSHYDARFARLEETIKWAIRLAITQAVTLTVMIVVYLATRGVGT